MIKLANWLKSISPSAMQKSLNALKDDVISFSLGLPAPELFPIEQLKEALNCLENKDALQYAPPLESLKSYIVEKMYERGATCKENEVFLTTGAHQGMTLLTRLLLNPKSTIILEEVVYPGFVQVVAPYQPNILTVKTDFKTGIDLEDLERTLKQGHNPALLYMVTDGHNPLGLSLSREKREHLANLASKYKLPIIEDDAYGFLFYDENIPSLRSFNSDFILYVGSFSKILAPSLRVGWLIVPEYLVPKLSIIKESLDINMATFSQRIVNSFIEKGYLEDHILNIRAAYKLRRDQMNESLKNHLPDELSYTVPNSGFFIWGECPKNIDVSLLFKNALEEKVSFIPGGGFAISNIEKYKNCLRLSFSSSNTPKIEEGIKRFSKALEKSRL
ncbi:MAG: PLP-dependent aminotransferase family protein [Proteobacteria bacterium]|nr:PLP-dependent aminotransferase family protein [Pseudomonadota bacterium]